MDVILKPKMGHYYCSHDHSVGVKGQITAKLRSLAIEHVKHDEVPFKV